MKATKIQFIQKVLRRFNQHNINYCILRNYEFLLGSADPVESLDTLVSEEDFPKVERILHGIGFTRRKQQFSLAHKAYFKHLGTEFVSFDIQIGGIHWNDMKYLDETVLAHRVRKGDFYVPSDDDTFVMLLVHSILGKRYFKQKYQRILLSLLPYTNKEYVLQNLSRTFNKKIAGKLYRKVEENDFKSINIKLLVFYFLIKEPQHTVTFTKLFFRWLHWKKPGKAWPLISIIGPDGAGKSTMVEVLSEHLREKQRKVSLVYTGRGRNQILPFGRIGRAYKKAEKKKDTKRFSSVSASRKILYTLTAPVFTLDLFLRYLRFILPKRRTRQIVLTDRYCSDIFLMKHVPRIYKSFLLNIFPKPTMTFYLYNSPEVLHERRSEESLEELERQLGLFEELRRKLGVIPIKTENEKADSERIIQRVERMLLEEWY